MKLPGKCTNTHNSKNSLSLLLTKTNMSSSEISIQDNEERMAIFNVFIVGTVALTLSSITLCSFSKKLLIIKRSTKYDIVSHDKYTKHGLQFGLTSSICVILFFALKMCCNDLIFAINTENQYFKTIFSSISTLLYAIEKLSFYGGVTFYYHSSFKKQIGTKQELFIVINGCDSFRLCFIICIKCNQRY